MNTKEMIKLLIDVEVDTEDLRLLKEHPKEHVATKREAWKLEQLFLLLENAKEEGQRKTERFSFGGVGGRPPTSKKPSVYRSALLANTVPTKRIQNIII